MEPIVLILLSVLVFVAVIHLISNLRTARPGSRNSRRGRTFARAHDPLITACLGDREKADRLAFYEKQRDPFITDPEARTRALERLTSDRSQ